MRAIGRSFRLWLGFLAVTVLAAACSSSGGAAGKSGANGGAPPAGVDTAAAAALIAPFSGHPSKFPVTMPLLKKATGKRIAFMDVGTPISGLIYTLSAPAAQALGMNLVRVKTGLTADSVASAFDSVVQGNYDGVFVAALAPSLWQRGLDKLSAAHIPVVTTGVTGVDRTKVAVAQVSDINVTTDAKALAGYVVNAHGAKSNVVLYYTPELPFENVMKSVFTTTMAALCPACTTRTTPIPAATLGNTSSSLVTNDLQAHPKTTAAVFADGDENAGVATALKTAGISVEQLVNSPGPAALEQVKNGGVAAALGLDLPVLTWTAMDSLARLATGEPADPGAVADIPPMQFLTKTDLTHDVSRGWTAYPDFAARFTALWQQAH